MTTDDRDPLRNFSRYFTVSPALTRADLDEVFRIRYRVYCEEFGYEPKARFPDGRETDAFDAQASQCLITHVATGLPAGCVRMCPASRDGVAIPLPFDACCAESLDADAMARYDVDPDHMCEASRFAVDGAFRRRSGEALTRFGEIVSLNLSDTEQRTFPALSVALMLAGTAMAELLERPYMFAVMEPFLPRLLKRSGMIFHRLGSDIDHHGIRAVYVTDTREFVQEMHGSLMELYWWIHAQLSPIATGRAESATGRTLRPRVLDEEPA